MLDQDNISKVMFIPDDVVNNINKFLYILQSACFVLIGIFLLRELIFNIRNYKNYKTLDLEEQKKFKKKHIKKFIIKILIPLIVGILLEFFIIDGYNTTFQVPSEILKY